MTRSTGSSVSSPSLTSPSLTPHTVTMRQRPCAQAELPRREYSEGFSGGRTPETIQLCDRVAVTRSQPLRFSIQAGVADPAGERRRRFGEHPADYLAGGLLVSRLPEGLVDTGCYVICPNERLFLVDSIRRGRPLPRWGYTELDVDLFEREAEIEQRDERVAVLGAQANANYSHWMVESVVRALLFRPFDDGSIMYLCPPLEEWQLQALALAGVARERILTVSEQRVMRFREVFAVSRGFSGLPWLIPGALSALTNLTRSTAGNRPLPLGGQRVAGGRRLFVSRSLVERRHITNEAQLSQMLERHGFQTTHPERLDVSEQIELFAGAEAVIGSWGSGLTNLIFSPPGTLVVELQPEGVGYAGNAFVWNIASIRAQRFAQVVCPVAEGMRDLSLGRRDMSVDVDHIEELLSDLLDR